MHLNRATAVLLVLAGASALAQSSAHDELERQLRELVGNPPTKIRIEFVGLDEPPYKIEEASFALDGVELPKVDPASLNPEGNHLIWHGDVKPGPHRVTAKVVVTDTASFVMSNEAGFKWPVELSVGFKSDPGIEVQVAVTPKVDRKAQDSKKRVTLTGPATLKMLAKLEDGALPPPPKPNLPPPPPDAGVPLTAAEKAKLAKQEAAEEARRKREEVAAARAEKARALEEAKSYAAEQRRAAAQAKAEAAQAKREAAADAKRAAAAASAARREDARAANEARTTPLAAAPTTAVAAREPRAEAQPAGDSVPATDAPATDAGTAAEFVPEAETHDAGAPAVAAREAPPQQPAPESSSGLPLPVILGGVAALVGLIIFFVARRRSTPTLPPEE